MSPMEMKRKPEDEDDEEEVASDSSSNNEDDGNDEDGDQPSRDSIKALLDPFGKDPLISLLKEAAIRTPSLAARISAAAESDPSHRKIFVHGLGPDATSAALAAAFAPFGEIEDSRAVLDRSTGRCKGYGFVLLSSRAAALRALANPSKPIGGRTATCQLASAGTGRKVFVSGVGENLSLAPERIRKFFEEFGEIEEGPLGFDKATGKLRGFAIFVYKSVEGCRKALEEPAKMLDGCRLYCQRAVEGMKQKTQAPAAGPAVLQPNDLALMGFNSSGLNVGAGLQYPPVGGTPNPYGVRLGIGGGAIGGYGSLGALQGMGGYSSGELSSMPPMSSQPGVGSVGAGFPPYFGR